MENTERLKVSDVLKMVDSFAPFETAEEWDNVGLLAGHPENEVLGIHCALDLTEKVIEEALENGANLIVTHHPILFRGRKNLRETDAEGRMLCRMIRENISLIAAHTNFDDAHPGVNDKLAQQLALTDIEPFEQYMCVGNTEPTTLREFAADCETRLGDVVRIYGDRNQTIRRVAVMGGAGGDFAKAAMRAGADVFVTGEISYHLAEDCVANGLCILDAGHAPTETPAVSLLCDALQERINAVKYNIRVTSSRN